MPTTRKGRSSTRSEARSCAEAVEKEIAQLTAAASGVADLTDADALPALDFLRSDLLAETGKWRDSDVMDGSEDREPYRSLARLLQNAKSGAWTTYFFGRFYTEGATAFTTST